MNNILWTAMLSIIGAALIAFPGSGETSPVRLDVNIIGHGRHAIEPEPPHVVGQRVTLSFRPGTGQLLPGGPIEPAQPGDPSAGWVFSHWSFDPPPTTEAPGGYHGYENPLELVLERDTTVFATFIETGSVCHPTHAQQEQLHRLAADTFAQWPGLMSWQVDAMADKAEAYLAEYRQYHEYWGQCAGGVFWNDYERTEAYALDMLGDGLTWTGFHLSALALKHACLPDDEQTIADMNRVLDAIDRCSLVTGTPGRLARFAGPRDDPAYRHYYERYTKNGYFDGVAPFEEQVWLGGVSRDVHKGAFRGLGFVLAYCEDEATWRKAARITERIVDRLIEDSWWLKDGTSRTYNNMITRHQQKAAALRANPEKYADFADDLRKFRLRISRMKGLYHRDYWTNHLSWTSADTIFVLTNDSERKRRYAEHFIRKFEGVRDHLNPYIACITACAAMEAGLPVPPSARATLEGVLVSWPDPPKWNYPADLALNDCYEDRDERYVRHVRQAAPPNHRWHSDFDGQRSAARTNKGRRSVPTPDGPTAMPYDWAGWDYYLLYWRARHAGLIPAPGESRPQDEH